MSIYIHLYLCMLVIFISQLATSDQCPAPSPCTCSGNYIYCNNKQFTSVPVLIGAINTSYHLNLNNNPDLVITDASFTNITLEYLSLDYDTNVSVSDHAFRTQTNTLRELHLSSAQLDEVPRALRDLHVLHELYMSSNHIQHWKLLLMETLTVSLAKLDISENALTSWPTWIRHLSNLNWLDVSGNPFKVIPHNAFVGFEMSLTYLDIRNTDISDIPTALQSLHRMAELRIGGFTLKDSSFYETWLPSHPSNLNTLVIANTDVTKIPVGLSDHSTIKSLYIDVSKVTHVDEESMPPNLTSFHMTHNLITHIHGGVCSSTVDNLLLDNNRIESIEKHDLYDCENLNYLSLTSNVIHYISPTAFDRLAKLTVLYLDNNAFVQIPPALQSLHSLSSVYLSGNTLECTCKDNWFPHWRQSYSTLPSISGKCVNLGIDLKDFNPHCSWNIIR